ncbi:hypothetical protein RHMOL_Rhmol07G0249400 [Rhododendron molle]|uniref:Uncharacterized protein n=1 Tax=Rhododendron molle TaxID=49168 RepID=A0ACC0N4P3_RHOML|nr:hypothetical protein RHMOL_Rhmol07G0249400 [Rhododendron molle]
MVPITEQWDGLCNRLLGIIPIDKVHRYGGKVFLRWLRANFQRHLVEGYTKKQVMQQAVVIFCS